MLGLGATYFAYDWARDRVQGSGAVALRNARQIVRTEEALGLYHERTIQEWLLHVDWFLAFWNIYYGTIHFVGPIAGLVWLYRRFPARYVRWRNTLLVMLALGIVCFWAYPLMPPRLMSDRYGFVDTAAAYFNFGPQQHIAIGADGEPSGAAVAAFGNLFAAMPSLHVGWSTWTVLAVFPTIRRRWVRALLLLYPLATIFAITVTGNHWLLDAVGGWIVLAAAWGAAVLWERWRATGSPA